MMNDNREVLNSDVVRGDDLILVLYYLREASVQTALSNRCSEDVETVQASCRNCPGGGSGLRWLI